MTNSRYREDRCRAIRAAKKIKSFFEMRFIVGPSKGDQTASIIVTFLPESLSPLQQGEVWGPSSEQPVPRVFGGFRVNVCSHHGRQVAIKTHSDVPVAARLKFYSSNLLLWLGCLIVDATSEEARGSQTKSNWSNFWNVKSVWSQTNGYAKERESSMWE